MWLLYICIELCQNCNRVQKRQISLRKAQKEMFKMINTVTSATTAKHFKHLSICQFEPCLSAAKIFNELQHSSHFCSSNILNMVMIGQIRLGPRGWELGKKTPYIYFFRLNSLLEVMMITVT